MKPKLEIHRLTLRGVDEKPHKKAPIVKLYRGFLFYSLLTEAGAAIGYKVAMGFERNSYTMSTLALLSLSILLLCSVINTVCSFIVSVFFYFSGINRHFLYY
jgi:hypothetical protein